MRAPDPELIQGKGRHDGASQIMTEHDALQEDQNNYFIMSEQFIRPTRSLLGRVAVVTGAGAADEGIGNGRASAILLAEAGCSVVCADIKSDLAERTAALITEEGKGKATAIRADVTKSHDCQAVVEKAIATYGRLDILVNIVGVGGARGTALEVDMEEWAEGFEINVSSMVMMVKYAIPKMVKNQGQWKGSIVNMGSVAGLRGGTPHLMYPTAKGAIVVR